MLSARRPRLTIIAAAVWAVVTLAASTAPHAASAHEAGCDGPRLGTVDHAEVVIETVTLTTLSDSPLPLGCIEFSNGAAQGPEHWYRLKAEVTAAFEGTPQAKLLASLTTDGAAAMQLTFAQTPDGLVAGGTSVLGVTEAGPSTDEVTVSFENYLQVDGVHEGAVPVSVNVEALGEIDLRRLRIAATIAPTDIPPFPVVLAVIPPPNGLATGTSATLRYTLNWDPSAHPEVESVSVEVDAASPQVRVLDVTAPEVAGHVARGEVRLVADHEGPAEVRLSGVVDGDTTVSTTASLRVAPAERGLFDNQLVTRAISGLISALACVLLWRMTPMLFRPRM